MALTLRRATLFGLFLVAILTFIFASAQAQRLRASTSAGAITAITVDPTQPTIGQQATLTVTVANTSSQSWSGKACYSDITVEMTGAGPMLANKDNSCQAISSLGAHATKQLVWHLKARGERGGTAQGRVSLYKGTSSLLARSVFTTTIQSTPAQYRISAGFEPDLVPGGPDANFQVRIENLGQTPSPPLLWICVRLHKSISIKSGRKSAVGSCLPAAAVPPGTTMEPGTQTVSFRVSTLRFIPTAIKRLAFYASDGQHLPTTKSKSLAVAGRLPVNSAHLEIFLRAHGQPQHQGGETRWPVRAFSGGRVPIAVVVCARGRRVALAPTATRSRRCLRLTLPPRPGTYPSQVDFTVSARGSGPVLVTLKTVRGGLSGGKIRLRP